MARHNYHQFRGEKWTLDTNTLPTNEGTLTTFTCGASSNHENINWLNILLNQRIFWPQKVAHAYMYMLLWKMYLCTRSTLFHHWSAFLRFWHSTPQHLKVPASHQSRQNCCSIPRKEILWLQSYFWMAWAQCCQVNQSLIQSQQFEEKTALQVRNDCRLVFQRWSNSDECYC